MVRAIILAIIPIVNIVIWLIVSLDLAKSFGRGTGFGVGLFFLSFIFAPILGFGSDTFKGPAAGRRLSRAQWSPGMTLPF